MHGGANNTNSAGDVAGNWYSVPELRLRDHYFTVPLDYSIDQRTCPKISVFAREVVSVGKEEHPLPYLLYLQGGAGCCTCKVVQALSALDLLKLVAGSAKHAKKTV